MLHMIFDFAASAAVGELIENGSQYFFFREKLSLVHSQRHLAAAINFHFNAGEMCLKNECLGSWGQDLGKKLEKIPPTSKLMQRNN